MKVMKELMSSSPQYDVKPCPPQPAVEPSLDDFTTAHKSHWTPPVAERTRQAHSPVTKPVQVLKGIRDLMG